MKARPKQKVLHIIFTNLSSFKFVQCWSSVVSNQRTRWRIIQQLKNDLRLTASSTLSRFHLWLLEWIRILKEILKNSILFNRIERRRTCSKSSFEKIFNLYLIWMKSELQQRQEWLNSWMNIILTFNIRTRRSINPKHKQESGENSRQLLLNSQVQYLWCCS